MFQFRDLLNQAIGKIKNQHASSQGFSCLAALDDISRLLRKDEVTDADIILNLYMSLSDVKVNRLNKMNHFGRFFSANDSSYFREMSGVLKSTVRGLGLSVSDSISEVIYNLNERDTLLAKSYVAFLAALVKQPSKDETVNSDYIIGVAKELAFEVSQDQGVSTHNIRDQFVSLLEQFVRVASVIQSELLDETNTLSMSQ